MTVCFMAAVVVGFALIVGLSANMQMAEAVRVATNDAKVKTEMLANAVRVGVVGRDGNAVEAEFIPLAKSDAVELASLRAVHAKDGTITDYRNPAHPAFDLGRQEDMITAALGSLKPQVRTVGDHVVVAVPVLNNRGDKASGALAVAWGMNGQKAAITDQVKHQLAVSAAVLVGLVLLLNGVIGVMVARPLRAMAGTMDRIAGGDTQAQVPATERRDEIGTMARAVRVFRDNAEAIGRLHAEQATQAERAEADKKRALVDLADRFQAKVSTLVGAIAQASQGMAESAGSMARVAEDASAQSHSAATDTDAILDNVKSVSTAAAQLAGSIEEIAAKVHHSAAIANDAVSSAERTNVTVQGLQASAERIGEVVQLINSIASQTNLLALNATIEAARAGEAGKGFAVVASEVKNLASQTAKATDDISSQIAAMQSVTREAVEAIQTIGTTIREINGIAAGVTAAVGEQNAATRDIASAVQSAAHGTQAVSRTVGGVAQTARTTGQTAAGVLSAAQSLSGQVRTLSAEVDSFLRDVRG
ncbi:methyl-accepting chemotaxis protein [Azospirillum fermentarium]|uniref:methyl-accepting chemotaxis protein n=1 Tax=Azospirillum fermentarium TaxID=1233114 RepID=UPI002226BC34|nr:HAMP domain-containing methyl-accepting chemotaxis protein [Azospirillum fermentarium]MCW2244554.1 methyl-accepting chemotaxis protein [Azospirillum fermentarium]